MRFLYYARHRSAGPVRAGARPVLGFAFTPRGEDGRPEGVFEREGRWG